MNKYHVGCGMFGIYAGTLNNDKTEWKEKTDVTEEAICAVRDYMANEFLKDTYKEGGYQWTRKDGKLVQLIIKEDGDPNTTVQLM